MFETYRPKDPLFREPCAHYWEPTSRGGQPVFKLQPFGPREPACHAKCAYCGDRTWFTEKQWWGMPAVQKIVA